jgi:hypothetical protein
MVRNLVATTSTPFPLGVFGLMGKTPVVQTIYIDGSQTPSEWASNVSRAASAAGASPTFEGSIPIIGLPMGAFDTYAPATERILYNFADGAYDSMLQSRVLSYANNGFKTQYWRPGVEMNLCSTAGFVGSSASLQALWIAAFQRIYMMLHSAASADGVDLKVMWSPGTTNDTIAGNATQTLWPGARYVDVIGADVYRGLQGIIDFAKTQGKPIAICETGAGATGDGIGLSDNPTFLQWLSSKVTNCGVPVDFVSPASAKPFIDVVITDAEAGETETASVMRRDASHGTLSDPNAAVDGNSLASGVWSVSGAAAAVAAALDGLVFTPSSSASASASAVTTTVTAAMTDPAGETASAASTITATLAMATHAASPADTQITGTAGSIDDTAGNANTITPKGDQLAAGAAPTPVATSFPPPADTWDLQVSENYTDGDAAVAVEVNGIQIDGIQVDGIQVGGVQISGDYQAHVKHSSGDAGMVSLTGNWVSGVNDVEVGFINHAHSRNLYVTAISEIRSTYAGTRATFPLNGSHTFAVRGATPVEAAPEDAPTANLSEDVWEGNAAFAIYIDGRAVMTPKVVTAVHDVHATKGSSSAETSEPAPIP